MKKGIIYVRVSSHEQVQGTSLANQQKACEQYAENHNIEIAKVFIEKGESATAANRTEFLKALDYCKDHKNVEAFIVWKIDRFARNTTDHFAVRAKLIQYGATLHSVTEPITQDPQGKLMETLLAGFAEFENDVRKQRCVAGMQSRLREGIWCWSPPIGYINGKKPSDRRKLTPDQPDPQRFELLQRAFKTYLSGDFSMTEIARMMNEWGFVTRQNKPMRKQLVDRMLKDKFYAGIVTDPWTQEEYKGLHKPMITEEEHYQVQRIKTGNSNHATRGRQKHNPDFPLRAHVYCPCGELMTAGWTKGRNKRYPYYHCKEKGCPLYGHTIQKQKLETAYQELLSNIKPKDSFLKLLEANIIDLWKDRHKTLQSDQKGLQSELQKLETKKKQLLEMRVEGELSKDEYKDLKSAVENKIMSLTISKNETEIEGLDLEASIEYAKKFITELDRQWFDMRPKLKQRLQKLVLPEGVTYNKTDGSFGTAVLSPIFELNRRFADDESVLVAGPGIAPGPGGYEPPEILLLHPAIYIGLVVRV